MLILRTTTNKGPRKVKKKFYQVIQREDQTLTIIKRDGTTIPNPGGMIWHMGDILGILIRCIEFDGTIEEYLASTTWKQRAKQWAPIDARWREFMVEYKKSLAVPSAIPEIS